MAIQIQGIRVRRRVPHRLAIGLTVAVFIVLGLLAQVRPVSPGSASVPNATTLHMSPYQHHQPMMGGRDHSSFPDAQTKHGEGYWSLREIEAQKGES